MTLAHCPRKQSVCVVEACGESLAAGSLACCSRPHATFFEIATMNGGILDLLMRKSNTHHVVRFCRDGKSRIDVFDRNEKYEFLTFSGGDFMSVLYKSDLDKVAALIEVTPFRDADGQCERTSVKYLPIFRLRFGSRFKLLPVESQSGLCFPMSIIVVRVQVLTRS
jgi:hypothetical protein